METVFVNGVECRVITESSFNGIPHYGILFFDGTRYLSGWIPKMLFVSVPGADADDFPAISPNASARGNKKRNG